MPLAQVHFKSDKLGKQVAATVLIPSTPGPWASFYLLHGLSDDHTIWQRRTRLEVYVERLPLLVVMPDGYRGFYTRAEQGPDYASYVGEEVVDFIDRTFQTKRSRNARAIGGLSMGGYGALRVGLAYPDRFASLNSHSGALMIGSVKRKKDDPREREFNLLFGPSPAGSDHDLLSLARRLRDRRKMPKIRIDCGTDDFLLESNRACHAGLEKLGVPHEYQEFPGAHTWDYWDEHVREALAFHAKNLKLEPA